MSDKIPVGNMLIDRGYLTQGQLDHAVRLREGKPNSSIREVLTRFGYVTEKAFLSYAAARDHIEVAPSGPLRVDRKAAAVIESSFTVRDQVLPMRFEKECLMMTATHPASPDVLTEMETLSGMEIGAMLAQGKELRQALRRAYDNASEHVYGEDAYSSMTEPGTTLGGSVSELSFVGQVESAPAVYMVNVVVEEAFHESVSGTHIGPGKDDLIIRIRINGNLMVHTTLRMEFHRSIITRLKPMVGMDIAEKRLPRDGKYHYERDEVPTSPKISTLPSIYGEKVVPRLLGNDRDNSSIDIRCLGMEEEQRATFEHVLKAPYGMVLVIGPTRSGKTTTLYAALNRMVEKKINIVTVESPTEKVMGGIIQIQVSSKAGLIFVSALHSILRWDPDVIMIGEIRDEGTVDTGVRAAITGHLVLSTPHTNGCAPTVLRLHSMEVPPYIVAASLSGIVAQRLVKLLCPSCRQPYVPGEREHRIFAGREKYILDKLWEAADYPLCDDTGYTGGIAVCETMDIDEQIRAMILGKESLSFIRGYQEQKGSILPGDYVLRMAVGGQTDMEEAKRILYSIQ